MATTSGGLPFPSLTDAADVPADLQALAEAVDDTKVAKSTFTAKGDLIAGTGAGALAAVTVGTNGHVLVADSAETAGVQWDSLEDVAALVPGDSFVGGDGVNRIVALTQAEYDAIVTPDPTTLYVVTD